jgi:EmrB/QacA subfamily drug resistance transporter
MRLEYKWAATLIGVLGVFMAMLDNTIVNVSLPAMQASFHTDRTTITWVITGYFLAQAAIIPVTGYLSDRFGTKLVFVAALTLFTCGSALCAFSSHESMLIAARVIQGLGGGALAPITMAIIYRLFPPESRGSASAIIGIPMLLAPTFGPTIGGYLTTTFNWNAIFLVNIPLGIIGICLGSLVLRNYQAEIVDDEKLPPSKGFDVLGLILSIVGVTSLVYGINKAGEIISDSAGRQYARGWTDHIAATFMIIGIVVITAFVIYELRSRDPVMDMRLFGNYTFSVASMITWLMSGVLFGSLFLFPVFFELVQGKTPLNTGEILIPQGLATAVGVIIAGRLYNRTGPRPLLIVGFVLTAIGSYGWTNLTVTLSSDSLQPWLLTRGLGLGLVNVAILTLVVSDISNDAMARASSLVSVTRQIASAVGVTALTAYWAQQSSNHVDTVTNNFLTSAEHGVQIACMQHTGQNVQAITACVHQQGGQYVLTHTMVLGLNDTFHITVIGCVVCVLLAIFAGRDPNLQQQKQNATNFDPL